MPGRRISNSMKLALCSVLMLLCACSTTPGRVPSLTVELVMTSTGPSLSLRGRGWQPGEQVSTAIGEPGASEAEFQQLTTILTDASGAFTAFTLVPQDARWANVLQLQVTARSRDAKRVAVASFEHRPLVTAVPTPVKTLTSSPQESTTALGSVTGVDTDRLTIQIRPVDTRIVTVQLGPATRLLLRGQQVTIQEVGLGSLLEATGQINPQDSSNLLASTVNILSTPTMQGPSPSPTPTLAPQFWQGEYYGNTTLSGNPILKRNDPVIDFDWQRAGPAQGLPEDGFAVRWSGSWPFDEGAYRFQAQVDDGIRVWLDGHLVIDQWYQSTGASYSGDCYVSAGWHAVRVEYFDAQESAMARVWWDYRGEGATQSFPDWRAEYYANMSLDGLPYLVVNDQLVDFDWGEGPAATGMPADAFSARWTTKTDLVEGAYTFHARADDGVRVWVNDALIIDHWGDGAAAIYTGQATVTTGNQAIRVEYYENAGLATIKLWWEMLPATPTPTTTPLPEATATP